MSWEPGRRVIEHLLARARLEEVSGEGCEADAARLLDRAELRLSTAGSGLSGGDVDGAFVAAYDAYRMAAEVLLYRQALRATAGEGSHVTVEDAVAAQFGEEVAAFAKPTFERFRRMRHAAQYFDPQAPELDDDDARWAIGTAEAAIDGTLDLVSRDQPEQFTSS